MLCLTIDTDWVPQFVLDHTLALLDAHQVRATIFCTSRYSHPLLDRHELALHPNLMADATEGTDEADRLHRLQQLYPKAIGIRTHRLYWHGGLHQAFEKAGLAYDSSLFCPLQKGLTAYREVQLLRFPLWWVDNFHSRQGFDLQEFSPPGLHEPGLKVLLFHPLQIYLNTGSLQEAAGLLDSVPVPRLEERVLRSRRRAGIGFETLFLSALQLLKRRDPPTLAELVPKWSAPHA